MNSVNFASDGTVVARRSRGTKVVARCTMNFNLKDVFLENGQIMSG